MSLREWEAWELLEIVRQESGHDLYPSHLEYTDRIEGMWFNSLRHPERLVFVRSVEHWRQLRAELYEREEVRV